jgi:hypothetical protein
MVETCKALYHKKDLKTTPKLQPHKHGEKNHTFPTSSSATTQARREEKKK